MRCALALLVLFYASLSQADSFDDFRIPAHRTWLGRINAAGTGSWGASTLGPHQSNLSSTANTWAQTIWDSDPRYYSLTVSTDLRYEQSRFRQESQSQLTRDANHAYSVGSAVSGGLREYPWKPPIAFSASLGTSAQRSWWHGENRRTGPSVDDDVRHTRRFSDRGVNASIGAGWGRVRDATSVFEIEVLEQRLQSMRVLVQPISRQGREKLAQLFYIRSRYAAVHDRPERFFWRDVESILREDGALVVSGLDAASVLLALEAFEPVIASNSTRQLRTLRQKGSFVGGFFQAFHQRFKFLDEQTTTGTATSSSSFITTSSRDAVWVGGQAEFHRPLGWRWQFDATSRSLMPVREDEHGFLIDSDVSAQWQIADRWRSDVGVLHHREIFEGRGSDAQETDWNVTWGARLAYFLEDRTQIHVEFLQKQSDSGIAWKRESQVFAGLEYRFLGRLDAPNLIAPERPLTMR